jgi:hypothetical protein
MTIDQQLIDAAESGDIFLVKQYISHSANPNTSEGKPLKVSAAKGHIEIISCRAQCL